MTPCPGADVPSSVNFNVQTALGTPGKGLATS